ncbi:MAG: sel1 repeat family protein [Alphaproteobacteria bacterium]|nr:sel1 repeat family protein [Alphaproteobacteria bacterium]
MKLFSVLLWIGLMSISVLKATPEPPKEIVTLCEALRSKGIPHDLVYVAPPKEEAFETIFERSPYEQLQAEKALLLDMAKQLLNPASKKTDEASFRIACNFIKNYRHKDTPISSFLLAVCFFEGKGIEKSPENIVVATELLRKSSQAGLVPALAALGYIITEGLDGEERTEERISLGLSHLNAAAARGSVFANRYLGYAYLQGRYVDYDLDQSYTYFSNIGGNADVETFLASVCLIDGNQQKALEHYEQSCKYGAENSFIVHSLTKPESKPKQGKKKTKKTSKEQQERTETAERLRQQLTAHHNLFERLYDLLEFMAEAPVYQKEKTLKPKQKIAEIRDLWKKNL